MSGSNPDFFAMNRALIFLALTMSLSTSIGDENKPLKYKSVLSSKPIIQDKNLRVWNIRKTETIRINIVEFKGELPLHKHPDADHSLLVLEGKVRVQVGGEKFEIEKGDFVSVPKDIPHKYWTLSDKAILVSMDAPYYDPKKTVRLE